MLMSSWVLHGSYPNENKPRLSPHVEGEDGVSSLRLSPGRCVCEWSHWRSGTCGLLHLSEPAPRMINIFCMSMWPRLPIYIITRRPLSLEDSDA